MSSSSSSTKPNKTVNATAWMVLFVTGAPKTEVALFTNLLAATNCVFNEIADKVNAMIDANQTFEWTVDDYRIITVDDTTGRITFNHHITMDEVDAFTAKHAFFKAVGGLVTFKHKVEVMDIHNEFERKRTREESEEHRRLNRIETEAYHSNKKRKHAEAAAVDDDNSVPQSVEVAAANDNAHV